MYFPFYKSGMSQVADIQDDGVPVSANFPRPNDDTERDEQGEETLSEGSSTKKRKLERDHFELVQAKYPRPINSHQVSDMRKSPLPYIGMISEAINSSIDKKMVLSEIYTYMEQHFFQYLSGKPRWRNTVRHNLSFHKCFVKCECSRRGNRSHYWSIHPDYIDQFERGNFTKTLSPPRTDPITYAADQQAAFHRNPRELRLFPNPTAVYKNYFHYEAIPPPNSNYIQMIDPSCGTTPSTSTLLHPHPELRSHPTSGTSSRSILTRIPGQLPVHDGNQRYYPTESVFSPYQYPHLLPVPWQYQHLQTPMTLATYASHEAFTDPRNSTSQNSPNTKT